MARRANGYAYLRRIALEFLERSERKRAANNQQQQEQQPKGVGTPVVATSASILHEKEVRRLYRTTRANLHIDYCLYSLRVPWQKEGKEEQEQERRTGTGPWPHSNFMDLRNCGRLLSHGAAQKTAEYLTDLMDATEQLDDSRTHYRACVALDTLLAHATAIYKGIDRELIDPIMQESLPDQQSVLHEVLFSRDTITIDARRHVMCKLLPRAGMPRRFVPILQQYMDNDGDFRRETAEIIVCSLLGNYEHCAPSSRADFQMRVLLYAVCMPITFDMQLEPAIHTCMRAVILHGSVELLSMFALREYLVFLIDEDPILRKHAVALFDYETFRVTVLNAMASVRVYIKQNIKIGGTMTDESIESGIFVSEIHAILGVAYATVVASAYRKPRPLPLQLLKATRGKLPPNASWAERMGRTVVYCSGPTSDEKCSMTRDKTRLEKRGRDCGEAEEEEEAAGGDDTESESDDDVLFDDMEGEGVQRRKMKKKKASRTYTTRCKVKRKKRRNNRMGDILSEIVLGSSTDTAAIALHNLAALITDDAKDVLTGEETKERETEDVMTSGVIPAIDPNTTAVVTRDCVLVEHCRILRDAINHIDPSHDPVSAFEMIMNHLVVLGAPQQAIDKHIALAHQQYAGIFTLRSWFEQLTDLSLQYPYTYNLIQNAASLWARHTSIRRYPLPLHYVQSQIAALTDRYRLGDSRCLPDTACRFVFCGVCRRVYSIVRKRPPPPKKKTIRPKPPLTHGYVDVVVDLATGHLYCEKGHSFMDRRCGDEPLTQITIIGEELLYGRASGRVTYILCAQPGCGQIALMHPTNTTFTEYGMACYSCTKKIRSQPVALPTPIADLQQYLVQRRTTRKLNASRPDDEKEEVADSLTCHVCGSPIASERCLFLFGYQTFVCNKHDIVSMRDHVRRGLLERSLPIELTEDEDTQIVIDSLLLEYARARKAIVAERRQQIQKTIMLRLKRAAETARIHR